MTCFRIQVISLECYLLGHEYRDIATRNPSWGSEASKISDNGKKGE